jgi:HD-like signal output (HDOD) protein
MNSHQGFLASVERDLLGGDAHFPTGLKVLAALRQALDDPQSPVDRVTTLVSAEPLVVARLLRLANCATFNPRGVEILTVRHAVQRVGFNLVRSAAAAVAIAQMRALSDVSRFADIADAAWLQSVQLSALARLLTPGHAGVNPDEAGLCGLVSELGTFYLLQRAARYPSYSDPSQRAALNSLLMQHGPTLSARLAVVLGLPDTVVATLAAWRISGVQPVAAPGLFDLMVAAQAMRPLVFVPEAEADPADELGQQARASLQELLSALDIR